MTRPVTVGLAQMGSPPGDAGTNRSATAEAAKLLFDQGAQLVVLPELAVPWYTVDPKEVARLAEPLWGPTVDAWTAIAADHSGLVVGGFCERDGEAFYNTAVVVDQTGGYRPLPQAAPLRRRKGILHAGGPGSSRRRDANGVPGIVHFAMTCGSSKSSGCWPCRVLSSSACPQRGSRVLDAERWDADGFCPQAHGAVLQAKLSQVFIACTSQVGKYSGYQFLGVVTGDRQLRQSGGWPDVGDRGRTPVGHG